MIQFVNNIGKVGDLCPNCQHNSIFQENIYKYWLIYKHTEFKCQYCGFTEIKKLINPSTIS